MAHWIRYSTGKNICIGTVQGNSITQYQGDMFNNPQKTDIVININDIEILTPCLPSKMIGVLNNFHSAAKLNKMEIPEHPWYFVKPSNTFAATNSVVKRPPGCDSKILFEGELGVVISKTCSQISVTDIAGYIFGYTCINDITAIDYIFNQTSFDHWSRAKCFDGFGIFGPVIATDFGAENRSLQTCLVGEKTQTVQDYSFDDMIYTPLEAVSLISHDMTLYPGDIISCGTSVGAGAMQEGLRVEITIDGIGTLVNSFQD